MPFPPIFHRASALCGALGLLLTPLSPAQPAAIAHDVEETYLKGYMLVQQAERLEKQANRTEAYFKYLDANDIFDSVARDRPDWHPTIVTFRRHLVRKKMDETRVYTDPQFRAVLRVLSEKEESRTTETGLTPSQAGASNAAPEEGTIGSPRVGDIIFPVEQADLGGMLSYGSSPIGMLATDAFGNPRHAILSENRIEAPGFSTRTLSTYVKIPVQPTEGAVPIIGDISYLGRLFRTNWERSSERTLSRLANEKPICSDAQPATLKGIKTQTTPPPRPTAHAAPRAVGRAMAPNLRNSPLSPNSLTVDSDARQPVTVPPECIALEFLSGGGGARLTWTFQPGEPLLIEASSDLAGWVAIGLATESSPGVFEVTDPSAVDSRSRFYRAVVP